MKKTVLGLFALMALILFPLYMLISTIIIKDSLPMWYMLINIVGGILILGTTIIAAITKK